MWSSQVSGRWLGPVVGTGLYDYGMKTSGVLHMSTRSTVSNTAETGSLLNQSRAAALLNRTGVDVLLGATAENAFYATGLQSLSQWLIRGKKTSVIGLVDADATITLVAPAG